MNNHPTLKTLEEFCAFYEKDGVEHKTWLFSQYQYAVKERQRYRDKDKRSRAKAKEAKAALPPEQRKKPGRPRKHPLEIPNSNTSDPGQGISA